MKKIYSFIGSAFIVAALTVAPATAQSTSGQGGSTSGQPQGSGSSSGSQSGSGSQGSSGSQSGSTSESQPRSGTQSGQTTGSRTGGDSADRDGREQPRTTSYGDRVGSDVPTQGTQTDQRGRTAAEDAQETSAGALRGQDRTFLTDAMAGNHAEIQLAQLAQQKASSQSVRDLAQAIEQHHQQAQQKLQSIASDAAAANDDPNLKPQHKQLQDRLSRLEGEAFDRAYASEMVKEHQKDIKKYEKAGKQLQHSGLKAYATETLPTLQKHLQMARSAQEPETRTR